MPSLILRFVGNDLHPTDFERADEWVLLCKNWIKKGLREIYFFVHEPDNRLSPDLVRYVVQAFQKQVKTSLKIPKSYQQAQQGSLF
jgi:hypothetical protein